MRRIVSTVALTGGLLAGAVVAPGLALAAPDDCESYSATCPPTEVQGVKHTKPEVSGTNSSTLPFTGGEIALLAVTGIAAVGAGAVLVTAGRRRRVSAHA